MKSLDLKTLGTIAGGCCTPCTPCAPACPPAPCAPAPTCGSVKSKKC
ncbi:hypothetical protein LRS73_19905 [Methylobacterium currus]|jgi:hypothetical protein|nr:hypothetical protein [Methylobacterium currus]UHC14788.1 hypothetical protein LRS73_19905 [Methylobacterium currus]